MKIVNFQKLKFLIVGINSSSCSWKCHWIHSDCALPDTAIAHPAYSKEESWKRGRCNEITSEFVAGIQVRSVALYWLFWDFTKPQCKPGDLFHCMVQIADRCGPLGWTALWQPERVRVTARHQWPFSGRAHHPPGLSCHCVQPRIRGKIIQKVLNINSEKKLIWIFV